MKTKGSGISLAPLPAGSKREALTDAIVRLAKRLGPDAQLPGVRELCRSLQVSSATLDRVLAQLEQQGTLVCHHGRGIFVSPSIGQQTVGLVFGGDVFGHGASPFWMQLVDAARTLCEGKRWGFRYYLDISEDKGTTATHGDLQRDLKEQRLHGLLAMTIHTREQLEWLKSGGAPVVLLSARPWAKYSVSLDHRAAWVNACVKELAGRGCKRMAFIGAGGAEANQAFESALGKAGLAYDRALHWAYEWYAHHVPHESLEQFAYSLVKQGFSGSRPDGIVILDDTMTRGALMALLAGGILPRRDVLIASLANKGSPVLVPYEADLILIENDPQLLVERGLEMLDLLMRGKRPSVEKAVVAATVRVGSR